MRNLTPFRSAPPAELLEKILKLDTSKHDNLSELLKYWSQTKAETRTKILSDLFGNGNSERINNAVCLWMSGSCRVRAGSCRERYFEAGVKADLKAVDAVWGDEGTVSKLRKIVEFQIREDLRVQKREDLRAQKRESPRSGTGGDLSEGGDKGSNVVSDNISVLKKNLDNLRREVESLVPGLVGASQSSELKKNKGLAMLDDMKIIRKLEKLLKEEALCAKSIKSLEEKHA